MVYRYLGEKTVQMKRWTRRAVHAAMTLRTLAEEKSVNSAMYLVYSLSTSSLCGMRMASVGGKEGGGGGLVVGRLPERRRRQSKSTLAVLHHRGPAQLLTKVKTPTTPTL